MARASISSIEEATRAAREDLEEAIRLDPNYAPAWAHLAWINLTDIWMQLTGEWHLSRIDDVISQFRRAIELDPNLAKAYAGPRPGDEDKGRSCASPDSITVVLCELGPSDPDNLLFHAITLFELGDLSEPPRWSKKR